MNLGSTAVQRLGESGDYRLLHKYLKERFADRLVLTFAQIQDIMGCPLPGPAWIEPDWWATAAVGARSTQSDAWTAAGRTATVNVPARCVVFEREEPGPSKH